MYKQKLLAIAAVSRTAENFSTSVKVIVEGVRTVALLDGGSPTTMMDVKLAQKCSLKWRRLNDGKCWRDAGGHRLNIMGAAVVSFDIGPWTFEDEVVVVDGLVHQLLIGVDIMSPRRVREA